MPLKRNRNINDVYEQEFEQRVMARIDERLDQFVHQLANRMNDMMNSRRRGDRNDRRSEGEESENPFFEGDGSSSDEQPDRPRRNQRKDNRHCESGMRVTIIEFDGDTLNPEGGLKCFKPGHRQSECKKARKRTLFAELEEWEDDGVADNDYEALVFDDDQDEEEIVSGDVGVNLMVRRSCLTPKAVGDDWLKHNIFTILGKICTVVVDPESCDNLIAEEAVQKLGLKTENRLKPYKLYWLKKCGEDFVEGLHDVHKGVRDNLVRANSKYKQDEDQKWRQEFEDEFCPPIENDAGPPFVTRGTSPCEEKTFN
uniref:Putative reverse transcriptase domain-containing protein n=1 Tax=Tanacetum cinerariifolium TaxID=118510 RepID=A0A6L2KZY6_TANCI|nr:putative reverse transcriptase domain-containing protein [Tanacetum cinerariifolium]